MEPKAFNKLKTTLIHDKKYLDFCKLALNNITKHNELSDDKDNFGLEKEGIEDLLNKIIPKDSCKNQTAQTSNNNNISSTDTYSKHSQH